MLLKAAAGMLSTKQLQVLEDDVEIPPQPQCPNVFPTKNLWETTEYEGNGA